MNPAVDEMLAQIRNSETMEDAYILLSPDIESDKLCRVALAWTKTDVRCTAKTKPETWDDVWNSVQYSLNEISKLTMLTPEQVSRYVEILRKHRLIYPDGTMSQTASKAIIGRMKIYLKGGR